MYEPVKNLAHAYHQPLGKGRIRVRPEDFVVEEQRNFGPSGQGEHAWLEIRKCQLNTQDVARKIAGLADVHPKHVGYAGLKDKQALTTQVFSVYLPGRSMPDWSRLENDQLTILHVSRHAKKIRRGALSGNRFRLWIRNFQGNQDALSVRLRKLAQRGVPNYFGEQRFGNEGNNLKEAWGLLQGRRMRIAPEQRSLYLSAARAWLFNQVLHQRIKAGHWDTGLPGDILQKDGSSALFSIKRLDAESSKRLALCQVHVTGPLPGKLARSSLLPTEEAGEFEHMVLKKHQSWIAGLERLGLRMDRRALRVRVQHLDYRFEGEDVYLSFTLSKGAYATAVLRELIQWD